MIVCVLLPLLSALLLWASFPPLDLGVVGWFALVPLFVATARAEKGWKIFLGSWLAGAVFFTLSLSWIRYAVPFALLPLGIYLGIYFPLFVWITRRLTRRFFPFCLSAPVVWLALEYARGKMLSGLPYLLTGYTQWKMGVLIQVSDIAGVWVVSMMVVLFNAALARAFAAQEWNAWRDREFRVASLTVMGLIGASLIYGVARGASIGVREGPEVAVVQPNIPQEVKLDMRGFEEKVKRILRTHVDMTRPFADPPQPDLVVWPESVIYSALLWDPETKEPKKDWSWYEVLTGPAKDMGLRVLMGTEIMEPRGFGRGRSVNYFNSAVLTEPDGTISYRYDKVHLVPFGEYLLFGDTLPFVRKLAENYMGQPFGEFSPGRGFPTFEAGGERAGVLVCFEVVFPEISREIAGEGASFAVNISNEGWYKDSAELDQMHAMARFRAVECRLGLVRCTNTGISAFFAPTGEIDLVLEKEGRRKEVGGVLRGRVRVTDAGSIYRKLGDALPWLCCGFVFAAFVLSFARVRGPERA